MGNCQCRVRPCWYSGPCCVQCCPSKPYLRDKPPMKVEGIPTLSDLERNNEPPDPLILLSGGKCQSAEEWQDVRREEIKNLFRTFTFGFSPDRPDDLQHEVTREEKDYFDGAASLQEITLKFGPEGAHPIFLLLVLPNDNFQGNLILSPNASGNQTTLNDSDIRVSDGYAQSHDKEVGSRVARWPIKEAVARGYGVATFHVADLKADRDIFYEQILGSYEESEYDWGAVAAWSWGLSTTMDYLETVQEIQTVSVAGHSRRGKTALLTGAMDERFAAVISNSSGCTGAAMSRHPASGQEHIIDVNFGFPHWFNDMYKNFNTDAALLPFDQHTLVSLIAPRPFLSSSGSKDQWTGPTNEFKSCQLASPIWEFLGVPGFGVSEPPAIHTLVGDTVGFNWHENGHRVGILEWNVWMDFLDKELVNPEAV